MGNKINQIPADCQVVHYCYDLNTHLKHAFIEKDSHLVEAVKSAVPFDPLESFYWLGDLDDPDFRRGDLVLDAEVRDNDRVRMEIHPGLFRDPKAIDLESVWFGIVGKGWEPGDAIRLGDVGVIWVMAFLRELSTAEIIEDKLFIHKKVHEIPPEFEQGKKKPAAAAPKKLAKIRRLNVPPGDVVKYFEKEEPLISWEPVLRAMYLVSWYDPVKRRRIFNRGVEWLAAWSGFSERQVRKIIARMKVRRVKVKKGLGVKGIIKLRGRGWPGEGASRWELPCNMGLVMRWRRNLRKK